jgi:alkyl hydroperoxide reductase subunit AhpF
MALLSDQDRKTVASHLADIVHPVKVLFFTQTIGAAESVHVTKQILDELVGLNEHISVEELNVILDRERAAGYGIANAPALVLLKGDEDTGIRFLGAPAGYEFMSLVEGLILAGTDDSGLTPASKELIASQVSAPLDILVFATPT